MATAEELMQMITGILRIQQEFNLLIQNQLAQTAGDSEDQGVLRDAQGYSQKELDELAIDFGKNCPTFDRGKDDWADFADIFDLHKRRYRVTDAVAKEALWMAVKGRSSRILIASMRPDRDPYHLMPFEAYMQEMAGKLMPASEFMQMKTAYESRKKGHMMQKTHIQNVSLQNVSSTIRLLTKRLLYKTSPLQNVSL
jgi:hypothetical protein